MKVYLAGPMRGYELFNFPAFDAAAARLRRAGIEVESPAEMDRELGLDPTVANTDDEEGLDVSELLLRDLHTIARPDVDGVALLAGAEHSRGAQAERAFAVAIGKGVWAYIENPSTVYTSVILAGIGATRTIRVPVGFDHFAEDVPA